MKKIFLDCGTHLCEGLVDFYNNKRIDESFEIHTFEANPACKAEERVKMLPLSNIKVYNMAVWTEDGEVTFNQENHKESRSGSPTDGYSDIDGWGSSVNGIGFRHAGYGTPITIKSINFSRFVLELPEDAYIICKMDIEGSEFAVLRHLIETKAIDRIKEIYVEFHDHVMENESADSKQQLISILESKGIKVNTWF